MIFQTWLKIHTKRNCGKAEKATDYSRNSAFQKIHRGLCEAIVHEQKKSAAKCELNADVKDGAFYQKLYKEHLADPEKGEFVSLETGTEELGISSEDEEGFVMSKISEVIPNGYPDGIMPDDKLTPLFRVGIRHAIEEAKAKGIPVARYDDDLKRAYLEHPDGSREYK